MMQLMKWARKKLHMTDDAIKKVWQRDGKAHEAFMKMKSQFEPLNNLMEKYGIMGKEGK